ncbi:hypothetical protein MR060_11730 [bacterium]|nr:hypothetical protein [bacterium]
MAAGKTKKLTGNQKFFPKTIGDRKTSGFPSPLQNRKNEWMNDNSPIFLGKKTAIPESE